MEGYGGTFFDGETAQRHEVQVHVMSGGLVITGEGGAKLAEWRYAELEALQAIGPKKAARLSCATAPEARLFIEDPNFAQRILPLSPQLRHRRDAGFSWSQVGMVTGVVALFVLGVIYGVPMASRPIAAAIPASWVESIGKTMRADIIGKDRICTAKPGSRALGRLRDMLARQLESPYAIEVTVVEKDMVNAFALPGGQVVIFSKLLEITSSPDELAGVLAHELGHVARRHPMQGALQAAGISLLVNMMVGDSSRLGGAVAGLGGILVTQSYSRDAEREADDIALRTLDRAGIDPAGLARAFQHMAEDQAKHDKGGDSGKDGKPSTLRRMSYYLGSHPYLADRMKSAKAAAKPGRPPALDPNQWRALRTICGDTAPEKTPAK